MSDQVKREYLKKQFTELQASINQLEERINELYILLYRCYEIEDWNAAFLNERDINEVKRNLGIFYNMRRRILSKAKEMKVSV